MGERLHCIAAGPGCAWMSEAEVVVLAAPALQAILVNEEMSF